MESSGPPALRRKFQCWVGLGQDILCGVQEAADIVCRHPAADREQSINLGDNPAILVHAPDRTVVELEQVSDVVLDLIIAAARQLCESLAICWRALVPGTDKGERDQAPCDNRVAGP